MGGEGGRLDDKGPDLGDAAQRRRAEAEARRAAALRENLRRRKQQAREREPGIEAGSESSASEI
jgi:hypothetical protein